MLWLTRFVQSVPDAVPIRCETIAVASPAMACTRLNLVSPGQNPSHVFQEMH